ncbi:hypothetical protein BDN67DRAFT_650548 [Paxillus ammoniavirescens]|nr:hypothetical protein BDN67DRAFT_650548 [Paxillus ammoniavirescens]
MDCCGKCLDYFCVGPRADRETFRPWNKKSRAVLEAEKQAKKEKRKGKGKGRKHRKTKAANSQNAVTHPPHHLDPQRDGIEAVSPTSPATDEADLQRVNLHLQAQVEQLRRQLDDSKREARAERDRLDKDIEELPHRGQESGQPQNPGLPTGSSNANAGPSSHAEPSRSTSHDDPSTPPHGSSTSSNVPLEGGRSRSTQFDLASIHVEEQAMKDKRAEDALSRPTSKAAQSQTPAADEPNLQRAFLELQGQVEELRRRFDDPKRKAEEKEGLENVYSRQESDEPHPRMHTGTQYPITTHFTQSVTNEAEMN